MLTTFARKLFEWLELGDYRRVAKQKLRAEAIAVATKSSEGSLVVLAESFYLPHGGSERLHLTIRNDGGYWTHERSAMNRETYKLETTSSEKSLPAEECFVIRNFLEDENAWAMGDHLEQIKDGMIGHLAMVQGKRTHAFSFHGGFHACPQRELLQWIFRLAGSVRNES